MSDYKLKKLEMDGGIFKIKEMNDIKDIKRDCSNCLLDWGCLQCKKIEKDKKFTEEYLKLLTELFGDDKS